MTMLMFEQANRTCLNRRNTSTVCSYVYTTLAIAATVNINFSLCEAQQSMWYRPSDYGNREVAGPTLTLCPV